MHEGIVEKIRAAGGEIFAITSEPQHLADQAHEHWKLDFETVGDPHQEIAQTCRERGWLTLYTHSNLEFLQSGATWEVEHPKGYFQPGVLALSSEARVLYRWRSVPSAKNLQGTLCRPTASHVWQSVEPALPLGPDAGDAAHDDNPQIDQLPVPLPIFAGLLVANGWFMSLRSFAYSPGVQSVERRLAIAGLRLVCFVFAWIAALYWLPTAPVAVVFSAWFLWIARDARRISVKGVEHHELAG